jgi:ATP-binding cassette, subfamily B, bacterial HlyB/CyaB
MGAKSVATFVVGDNAETNCVRLTPLNMAAVDQRLQAMVRAAWFHGRELDPAELSSGHEETPPSAASLAAWAQESGLWSRAVRLRWRHLMRLRDSGPVVLLLSDGGAALLTGVDAGQDVVWLEDPVAPNGAPAVAVDELRLMQV